MPAQAADPIVVELAVEGALEPATGDAVALGVQPRRAGEFSAQVTGELAGILRARSVAFEVLAADGFVDRELHGVVSPAGLPEIRFVVGRSADAVVRIGGDGSGGALVAVAGDPGSLSGVARRPGIVTPSDVVSTILLRIGIVQGDALQVVQPVNLVELRARLARDARAGGGLAIATVVVGVALLLAGAAARTAGMSVLTERIATAVLLVPAGYLAGLFIPSGSWTSRALPLLVAPAYAALPSILDRRTAGVEATPDAPPAAARNAPPAAIAAAIAASVCVLTLLAAARPSAEPALSLWANPFDSTRFFGLRNHLVAFVAGSLVFWIGSVRPPRRTAIAVVAAATMVVGLPWLGANFGGVLTLLFGATLAAALAYGRPLGARALGWAAAVAIAGTAVALLLDTGSPVSHGGRAVRSVGESGPSALADIVRNRAQLNWAEVTDLGAVGFAGAAVVVVALVALAVWGSRRLPAPPAVIAVAGAAMALLAVATEDSGFFTGGILGLYPAAAWLPVAGREPRGC